jgi:predicted  nucleic acid-binding Zn-ribbon protein
MMAYSIDQLADELVHLRGPFFERVLDRLTEDEAKRFFELACPGVADRVSQLEDELDGWEFENGELEREIDDLKDEIDDLKAELREAQSVEA